MALAGYRLQSRPNLTGPYHYLLIFSPNPWSHTQKKKQTKRPFCCIFLFRKTIKLKKGTKSLFFFSF
jgi:hypothetical protein